MITGVEHVALCSKDTAALKDWYLKVMGFSVVYDNGKGTYFLKMASGDMLELITAGDEEGPKAERATGIRHIALAVDNFEQTVEDLKSHSVEVVTESVTAPNGVKTFFFRDLDGNILHLIDRPKPLA